MLTSSREQPVPELRQEQQRALARSPERPEQVQQVPQVQP